jgi:hypothetical protein
MSSFQNQTQNYIPRYVDGAAIWTVLGADVAIFTLSLIFFLCIKDRAKFAYYFRPQAGRKPSEFYPAGIRERREIRERQIERMKAMRVPRPETLSVNDDGVVVELNDGGDEQDREGDVEGDWNLGEGEPDSSQWGVGGSQWAQPKLRRAPPASSIRGVWRWLWTTMRIPDSMIFRIYGIDVWAYLQFLKFCIAVFFILSIIALAVYLPTNMTGGNHMHGWNSTGMANLPPGDDRAYIHLAGTYLITFIITFLSFKYFKQFTRYRQRYKKLALLNNFSCMVTNVPLSKGVTTSAKLQAFFEKLYPNQVASATLLFNLKPLERKIKDRQAFIIALDRAIAEFQRTGIRPTHSVTKIISNMTPEERKMFGLDSSDGDHSSDSGSTDDRNTVPLDDIMASEGTSGASHSNDFKVSIPRSSSSSKKPQPFMVDSMLWYQKQIDDLDEEIELERKRVEESEDLQEAVPIALSSTDNTIPPPTSSTSAVDSKPHGNEDFDRNVHADDHVPGESDLEHNTSPSNKKASNRQSVLWRLAKKIQPDREEDEEILNEPFELSDIPAEVDPAIAQLTDEERRILASTTALVDPKYAKPADTLSTSYEPEPLPSSVVANDEEMILAPSNTPGDAVIDGTILSTPTIDAARARRLTRSISRTLPKVTSKPSSGFNAILYSIPPSTATRNPADEADTNAAASNPAGPSVRSSISSGTSAMAASMDTMRAPVDSMRTHLTDDFVPRLASSGSLTHLPIVSAHTPSAAHSRRKSHGRYVSTHVGGLSPSRPSVHQPQLPQHFVDYDIDDDEAEEERLDAQESILDRLMIRLPGWEMAKKTWRNWVVGAPKEVMGKDGIVRESLYRPTTVGFVTFKTIVASNHCANSGYLSKSFFKWRVEFAPAESDIQWRNMRLGWWQQWIRYLIMLAIVCVLIIFWGVPTGVIAQWGTIDHLENMSWSHNGVVWLKSFGPFVADLISRLSPTLTLLIFMNLLVPVIRVLFDYVERPPTKSGQEMKVFRVYYAFLLFNVLFLSTLTSQISNIVAELIRNPSNTVTDIARHLGETLPLYGAFFINYILNATFLSGAMGLPRLMFFIFHFIQLKFAKSPSEIERVKKESVGGFEFDYQYASHLNIFTIALAYSSMVPLIMPAALLYFVLWFSIDKYNLIFAYEDNFDRSGGWTPLVFRRVFAAIAIFHFTMFGTFLVKQNYIASGMLLPLFIFDLLVHWYAINTFALRSQFVPLDEATRYPHTAYQLGLEDGYIHPAMHDLPDSLYSTRYETRPSSTTPRLEADDTDNLKSSAIRLHPSLAKDSASSAARKRVQLRTLGDELGLSEQ